MELTKSTSGTVIGIDIGSVSMSVVQMDFTGTILKHIYHFHKGNIRQSLNALQGEFNLTSVRKIGCTNFRGIGAPGTHVFDHQVAIIEAAKVLCGEARSILWVGAEKFMVITFNEDGSYRNTNYNSSCAAGTGSFLDQQAGRLNLSGIEELCTKALNNKGEIPEIAARCAVFAKTDLIHAQQKGFSLEAICDSLCKGLATNIVDTVFNKTSPPLPVLFAGGVSNNKAVALHLEKLLDTKLLHHEHAHLLGSIGVGFLLLQEMNGIPYDLTKSFGELLIPEDTKKEYYYEPLSVKLVQYPDFSSEHSYIYTPVTAKHADDLQVDLYFKPIENAEYNVYLGIDIGSTSTKAIVLDNKKTVLAGFYTYTVGSPVTAIQAIFEAIHKLLIERGIKFNIQGAGTTGSGRKFVGKIIRADLILDEITAHARAAYELNPDTDTIIEIGGQDAKFTIMEKGTVTFSQMNTVCAAGTGSFIEEQAKRLGCTLEDYSNRAAGVRAPLASDRCTVFMERDINQLLNQDYPVNEILATALHSVVENYLKKVATEASIGKNICFQGATARNRSLVAAFEQKLKQQIFVSKYCHLTGAMGVALLLLDGNCNQSVFRGMELYRETIKVTNETCELCTNRCQISLANVQGKQEAYGFLCGRDYDTQKYININTSGFNLLDERRKLFSFKPKEDFKYDITIGIPAAIHLFEETALWKRFFYRLGIRTITSENFMDPVKTGKRKAGAEFCSPIDALYGHILYLAEKADYIFLPVYLQTRNKPENAERNYFYYTQFSGSLAYTLKEKGIQEKCLFPFLNYEKGKSYIIKQLQTTLKGIVEDDIPLKKIRNAYEEAWLYYDNQKKMLEDLFRKEHRPDENISVALLGRPYVVLSKALNKGIPDIVDSMGVKSFFLDMIPPDHDSPEEIEKLLKKVPWYYAARILEATKTVATTPNLYPVLVTAFKCAPDSFIIEYFKKLLHIYNKPYLILQIDDHDSNVGYETRIEAALRSFRNHASSLEKRKEKKITTVPVLPKLEYQLNGKTMLFPGWDPIVSPLLVANLRRSGIDARLLESSDLIIKKSMAHNSGQCLPLNIITQEFIEYIEKHNLDPANTMLWMVESKLTCNIRLYPFYMKSLLEEYGKGMEKADVYSGKFTHIDLSVSTTYYAYFAYMLGGLIRKMACKIRPYESEPGETHRAIEKAVQLLVPAFEGNGSIEEALVEALSFFENIKASYGQKPKVAIFGDFYVRDNDVMNQELIKTIECAGGEVLPTPYNDYVKITVENNLRRSKERGDYLEYSINRILISVLKMLEDRYYRHFKKYLGAPPVIQPKKLEKHLEKFNVDPLHSGESYDNILKIFYLIENFPDIRLFVQTNPAFCCPSLITEAMTEEIHRITGIPVITITYDGTSEFKNDVIVPYLQCLDKSRGNSNVSMIDSGNEEARG